MFLRPFPVISPDFGRIRSLLQLFSAKVSLVDVLYFTRDKSNKYKGRKNTAAALKVIKINNVVVSRNGSNFRPIKAYSTCR